MEGSGSHGRNACVAAVGGANRPVRKKAAGTRSRTQVRPPILALIEPRLLIRVLLATLLAGRSGAPAPERGFRIHAFGCAREFAGAALDHAGVGLVVVNLGAGRLCDPRPAAELSRLRALCPRSPLAVFSDRDDPAEAREAVRRGVQGYIPTRLAPDAVLQALCLIQAGGCYVPSRPSAHGPNAEPRADERRGSGRAVFTRREWQVMERLRRGQSNKAIAYALSLHESTVKVYVRQIMRKLCATNRTHAAFLISQRLEAGR